jgi:hypothetical protein
VNLELDCDRGTLGSNQLWRAEDPPRDVPVEEWTGQMWTFSPSGSAVRWVFPKANVDALLYRQEDGSYEGIDDNSPAPSCPVDGASPERPRTLHLNVFGEPHATEFQGWLRITFTCQDDFVARLRVSGEWIE